MTPRVSRPSPSLVGREVGGKSAWQCMEGGKSGLREAKALKEGRGVGSSGIAATKSKEGSSVFSKTSKRLHYWLVLMK